MIQTKTLNCPSCGAELLDPIYDLEMVDGGRRRLTCGECGRPFTVEASLVYDVTADGEPSASPLADAERAANADVDGSCRFLAGTGRCGRPTTDGSRWCAAHADLWAKDGAHAVGLWRFPEVLYGDVVDFRPPMPVSADEMRQWAKSTADLLRLGFGAMDEKEARRWSTPPSL